MTDGGTGPGQRIFTALTAAVGHLQAGRGDAAMATCAGVLILDPAQGDALHLLGVLHGMTGAHALAFRWQYRALRTGCAAAAGNLTAACLNLGAGLLRDGVFAKAESVLLFGVVLDPGWADVWSNASAVALRLKRWTEAGARARRALRSSPDHVGAHNHAAQAILGGNKGDGRSHLKEALIHLQRVLAISPAHPECLRELGLVLFKLQHPVERAIGMLRRSLRLAPDAADTFYALGTVQEQKKETGDVEATLRRGLALDPGHAAILDLLTVKRHERSDSESAFRLCGRSLRVDSESFAARALFGSMWVGIGEVGKGIAFLKLSLDSDEWSVNHRNYLCTLLYDPTLDREARFAEQCRIMEKVATPLYRRKPSFPNDPDPDRRITVGYLSSDLHSHPVSLNLEPLIAGRDRSRFSVHFFADIVQSDETTARMKALADGWHDVTELDDEAVAERVRAVGVDILVVVAGHFDRNRPLVAARRAAPVQVSLYDGATSALETMDYILTDRAMTPPGGLERFTERPVRLPRLFVYRPLEEAPPPSPPPLLTEGFPTFGSFSNPSKLNDLVLDLWGRLLAQIPGSRLMLRHLDRFSSPPLRRRILSILAAHGVAADRILMPDARLSLREHLELYNRIDVALDPFPFCGATTTFESLWMGVPVVALSGQFMMSRWSGSLLEAVGLDRLVAPSPEDYLEIAAGLVADPQGLAAMRVELAGRLAASPVCDGRRGARHLERAYRAMWRRWCRDNPRQTGPR